jgi:formylmethanofuran dehydrogenase subunit D
MSKSALLFILFLTLISGPTSAQPDTAVLDSPEKFIKSYFNAVMSPEVDLEVLKTLFPSEEDLRKVAPCASLKEISGKIHVTPWDGSEMHQNEKQNAISAPFKGGWPGWGIKIMSAKTGAYPMLDLKSGDIINKDVPTCLAVSTVILTQLQVDYKVLNGEKSTTFKESVNVVIINKRIFFAYTTVPAFDFSISADEIVRREAEEVRLAAEAAAREIKDAAAANKILKAYFDAVRSPNLDSEHLKSLFVSSEDLKKAMPCVNLEKYPYWARGWITEGFYRGKQKASFPTKGGWPGWRLEFGSYKRGEVERELALGAVISEDEPACLAVSDLSGEYGTLIYTIWNGDQSAKIKDEVMLASINGQFFITGAPSFDFSISYDEFIQRECRTQVQNEVKAIGEQIGIQLKMGELNPKTGYPSAPFHPTKHAKSADPRRFTAHAQNNGNPWFHYDNTVLVHMPRSTPGVFSIQRDNAQSQLSVIAKTDCDSDGVEAVYRRVISLPNGKTLSHGWITPDDVY